MTTFATATIFVCSSPSPTALVEEKPSAKSDSLPSDQRGL